MDFIANAELAKRGYTVLATLPDGFQGIHFNSNLTSPIGNIEGIHIPSLFMGMTGSYEYLTSEALCENSPATDKTLAFVEGVGHMFLRTNRRKPITMQTTATR